MSSLPAGVMLLDSDQTSNLHMAVDGLSPSQLQWVSGYAAGLAAAAGSPQLAANMKPVVADSENLSARKLRILYGSQTGNAEAIAIALAAEARSRGFAVDAISLADYKPANLKRESLVTFVVSTHGEGDPPDDAELIHDYLFSKKAPELSHLQYSVLALGDSSYVNFCETGREFDSRLHELGAQRIEAVLECDLDYDTAVAGWTERVIAGLPDLLGAEEIAAVPLLHAVKSASVVDKSNPFRAEILANQKITGGSSSKDVRHIELSLEGSGITYEPGDSLAVIVENPPQLVTELLAELQLDGDALVTLGDQQLPLADVLRESLEITAVSLGFLRDWANLLLLSGSDALQSVLDGNDTKALADLVAVHQIIDVVRQYPAHVGADEFAGMLRRLSPRSYSISSSLSANPDEVHLTVAAVRYEAFGSEHWGAASTHLVDRLREGDFVSVFVERNTRFQLPAADVPIVMIGPGTGVAPFRSFVEERVEQRASGDNWLFFGYRNLDSDFLYQLEWQRYLKQGHLRRLDVAFSRDQRKKIYVQDRIRENSAELYRWIERGAVIYVCGDAKQMANDVNDALTDVLTWHGGFDSATAVQKLKELRAAGRYQRDVY